MTDIDWTVHDQFSENTCTCKCGAVFRSHSKCVFVPNPRIVSRKPCPACGDTYLARSSSDVEIMEVRGK